MTPKCSRNPVLSKGRRRIPPRRAALWRRFGSCLRPTRQPWPVRRAARVLHGGGVIAYPTEAVWGLGCDPRNHTAVERLLSLKGRPQEKGVILIAADLDQLAPWLAPIPRPLRRRLLASWPGPVTWLLPPHPNTPDWLRGKHDTLAVRVTDHPGTAALCRAFGGALISTSANPGGAPPARNRAEVRRYFGAKLDYLLDGPTGGLARPTTIRDARSGRVIRRG